MELRPEARKRITEALRRCGCVENLPSRQAIVSHLSKYGIGEHIEEAADLFTHVENIVRVCCERPSGIERLEEIVAEREQQGGTYAFEKLRDAIAEAFVLTKHANCDVSELSVLRELLASITLHDVEIGGLFDGQAQGRVMAPQVGRQSAYNYFLKLYFVDPDCAARYLMAIARHASVARLPAASALTRWRDENLQTADRSQSRDPVYVMIRIEKAFQAGVEGYTVRTWDWRAGRPEYLKHQPHDLDDPDKLHKFEEVAAQVEAAIAAAEASIADEEDPPELLVELFAESDVIIARDVSHWEVRRGRGRDKLLLRYPVVWRWLYRQTASGSHRADWKKRWKRVRTIVETNTTHDCKWLPHDCACSSDEIKRWDLDAEAHCMVLEYVPAEKDAQIETALDVGVSIAMWLGRAIQDETICRPLFDELMRDVCLTDLPAHIHRKRAAHTNADAAARRLTLLFDDADRMLPGFTRR